MNREFLGDAHDCWKGAWFQSLQAVGALRDFAVDPMASDLGSWTPQDLAVFAHLLRIEPSQLIQHQAQLKDRERYFSEISHLGDLFLDPDTGVATSYVRPSERVKYIRPSEIERLLNASPNRLLAIYQYVSRERVSVRIAKVVRVVREQTHKQVGACCCESANVAMLFLSLDGNRTALVAHHFARLMGRSCAARRVRTL